MSYRQEDWSDSRRLSSVLVNGDDMLYVGSRSDYTSHTKLGGSIGLKMSVGKAYWHPVYANINSTSVHCDLANPKSTPWLIPFLNTGLYFGAHKVQRKSNAESHHEDAQVDSLAGNLNLILEGSLPGRQGDLLSSFLRRKSHARHVRKETRVFSRNSLFSRNLFLPISLGGMGILPPPGFKYRLTTFQRRLASAECGKRNFNRFAQLHSGAPYPDLFPISKVERVLDRPWYKEVPLDREVARVGSLEGCRPILRRTLKGFLSGVYSFTDTAGVFSK